MDQAIPNESTTRRDVLAALAVCGCGLACAGEAQAQKQRDPPVPKGPVDVGVAADFKKPGVYDAKAKSHHVILIRQEKTLVATSAKCTHKFCVLKKKDEILVCPCHSSEFDLEGIPLNGPAKTSLPRFAITLKDGKIIVDTNKVFEEKQWGDAAASLTLAE